MPAPATFNPFEDEIEAEYHSDLLKFGNLGKKKPEASWSDENRWTSQGYLGKVNRIHCACGATTETLVGVFHRETTPSGKSREQALNWNNFQVPLDRSYPVEVTDLPARVCAYCLPHKGFERF